MAECTICGEEGATFMSHCTEICVECAGATGGMFQDTTSSIKCVYCKKDLSTDDLNKYTQKLTRVPKSDQARRIVDQKKRAVQGILARAAAPVVAVAAVSVANARWAGMAHCPNCKEVIPGITEGCDVLNCPKCNKTINLVDASQPGAHTFHLAGFFNAVKAFRRDTAKAQLDQLKLNNKEAWSALCLDELIRQLSNANGKLAKQNVLAQFMGDEFATLKSFLESHFIPKAEYTVCKSFPELIASLNRTGHSDTDIKILEELVSLSSSTKLAFQKQREQNTLISTIKDPGLKAFTKKIAPKY
jgi:hypothetical protein